MKLILIKSLFGLLLLNVLYNHHTNGECPPRNVLSPLTCTNNNIFCGGNTNYDLKLIFESLSNKLNESEKQFNSFNLHNTGITELADNVFKDITFESIVIEGAYNLTSISTHAFVSSKFSIKEFSIIDTPYGNISAENNIFDAINSMVNIESVFIENTSITYLPSNAFSVLENLTELDIGSNLQLKTLGNNSFYELNNLEILSISNNQLIDYIGDNVFNFRNMGNKTLAIYLKLLPLLTTNSFTSLSFANINRPFKLMFFANYALQYLDERIFGTVLSNGNIINLLETRLECDCKMYWIYKNRLYYEKLLQQAYCQLRKPIFNQTDIFSVCEL